MKQPIRIEQLEGRMQESGHDELEPAGPQLRAYDPVVEVDTAMPDGHVSALQRVPGDHAAKEGDLNLGHEVAALGVVVREDVDDGRGDDVEGHMEELGAAGAAGAGEGVADESVEGAVGAAVLLVREDEVAVCVGVGGCPAGGGYCEEVH